MTAKEFIETLTMISQYYLGGIPKREIFLLAKESQLMEVVEVIYLLKNEKYDFRLGAVSILDWKARNLKNTEEEKYAIYAAYINNHK